MSLFNRVSAKDKEIARLRKESALKDREISRQNKEITRLKDLCDEKNSYFKESISDGLRHGSPLAAKHMSDRKKYLNGK